MAFCATAFSGNIQKMKHLFLYITAVLLMSSCASKFQKLVKSDDYYQKYVDGLKYYEEGDYERSQILLESIVTIYKGTERDEKIKYTLALCYYQMNDFITAGFYFKHFNKTFPLSEYADDSHFFMALCHYYLSPDYKLDQDRAEKGMTAFKIFVEKFPESEHVAESNRYIEELYLKLSKKAFYNAKLYHKIGEYRAAVIALKEYINKYPDSDYREETLFLILESSYLLAENSVAKKQYERYEATIDEYYEYIDEFPGGKDASQAEKYFNEALKFVKKS